MAMSKKDFIALADALRPLGNRIDGDIKNALCRFMRSQNQNFKEDRWLNYLAGECGPSGGRIKEAR